MVRPKAEAPRDSFASVRLTAEEHADLTASARALGLPSISEYLRHLHNQNQWRVEQTRGLYEVEPQAMFNASRLKQFFQTKEGVIYLGNSLDYLFGKVEAESVDLIVTSPPFGLVRKKSYGNEDADDYCDWFRPFAEGFARALKPNGSLVIDIGGAWKPGTPTRSLYHFELLIMLCKEYGFHLCQEHFWWNPSKLPTPAEWVNVRRVRVKDAVNCIWWLSRTPWPKASNRRVLAPYSNSMLDLLKNGYSARLRPSGHDISDKFQRNNGGAVPPNLLAIANTESSGKYQEHCRKNGLDIHPARFPAQLPEYFMRMLTNPGDLVVDPFAGSCVTGMVAQALQRRWACIELSEPYLQGALGRFDEGGDQPRQPKAAQYTIQSPCTLAVDEQQTMLAQDGGQQRPTFTAVTTEPPRSRLAKLQSRQVKAVSAVNETAPAGSQTSTPPPA